LWIEIGLAGGRRLVLGGSMALTRGFERLVALGRGTLSKAGRFLPLGLVILASCTSNPVDEVGPIPLMTEGVYVLNEGVGGQFNSTLTYLVPDSNEVYQDVFRAVNGRFLGDTGSDIVVSGSLAYIVVAGSDKIEVIHTSDNVSVGTILLKAGRNPFSFLVARTNGYVTNHTQGGSVTVVDLATNTVQVDSIPVGPYPEGMTAAGGKVYVCNADGGSGRTVSVIDATTNRVVSTIQVGDGPSRAEVTSAGGIWVMCTGSYGGVGNLGGETPGTIFAIDPYYDEVYDSISVDITAGHPLGMAISSYGYAYVVTENRVLKYDTRSDALVSPGFILGSAGSSFYSIAVDDYTNSVYIGDAKDFQQLGEVWVYSVDGSLKGRYDTGIAPVSITFKR
jgi:YVTN family beta-propeller protein